MYNYLESIKNDVRDYIENEIDFTDENWNDCIDFDDFSQKLYEVLFLEDSITGNASGSYTFSTWRAEENLCHNLDLLKEAIEYFDCDLNCLDQGAEACDVTIRCYLLADAMNDVLPEFKDNFYRSRAMISEIA